jgi:hypothetical protein
MASASSSLSPMSAPVLHPTSEKLTRMNFPVWKVLVLSALKGAQLSELLEDTAAPVETHIADDKKTKTPNPEFAVYVAKQQQVLNFLLTSLSKYMLEYVGAYTTPQEVWGNIVSMASSQSQERVINTQMALSTSRKGNQMVAQYVSKMKALADDMAVAGKKLDDEDLVSYILACLNIDFESVISAVAAHAEPISMTELYGQLVGYEQRQELLARIIPWPMLPQGAVVVLLLVAVLVTVVVLVADVAGAGAPTMAVNIIAWSANCVVRRGHMVQKCFKRFHRAFTGEEKSASAATGSYDVDTTWYADSGATDHITGELEKLTAHDM